MDEKKKVAKKTGGRKASRKRAGAKSGAGSKPSTGKRQRTGAIQYVCEKCDGEMVVGASKSYPAFLAKKYRCLNCNRQSDVRVPREVRKI